MDKLMDAIQVDTIHDWEVRHLCDSCEYTTRFQQPKKQVVNLGVSTAPRARICQNCNTPAGDRRLATGRIYEVAIGTPRAMTPGERKRLDKAIDQIDNACQKRWEKRFLNGIDRLTGLFVHRYAYMGLTPSRAYRLVPKDLRQLIDDLDNAYFKEG